MATMAKKQDAQKAHKQETKKIASGWLASLKTQGSIIVYDPNLR
ncbi:MAG: hypothetical protein ACI3Z5_03145 [Paludibacteraceae bacterium]